MGVHIPNCVLVSNVPLQSSEVSGRHPIGLLRFRHYLEVRRRACHLPDFYCQISKEVSIGMMWRAWLPPVFQVVQTLLISIVDVVPSARAATGYENPTVTRNMHIDDWTDSSALL